MLGWTGPGRPTRGAVLTSACLLLVLVVLPGGLRFAGLLLLRLLLTWRAGVGRRISLALPAVLSLTRRADWHGQIAGLGRLRAVVRPRGIDSVFAVGGSRRDSIWSGSPARDCRLG